jgi:hypothetical protein
MTTVVMALARGSRPQGTWSSALARVCGAARLAPPDQASTLSGCACGRSTVCARVRSILDPAVPFLRFGSGLPVQFEAIDYMNRWISDGILRVNKL